MKRRMLKQIAGVAVVVLCAAWCQGKDPTSGTLHLRTYELDIFGPSAEAAIRQAAIHCIRSAIGESYAGDEMILGRFLLERYLERYYQRFIASQKTLSLRESEGMTYLRVLIIVNVDALNKDLREKQFLYKPRRRPIMYVSIAEAVDDSPTSGEPISRTAIHETLGELLMRFDPRVVYGSAANSDLTRDPQQLRAACEAAQRAGVEVLLTGQVNLKLRREKPINFDDYFFYDADATLTLVRADDAVILDTGVYNAMAGNTDKEAAKRVAASRGTAKILQNLIPKFAERWERTMTDNVEFQVMVVGVNPSQADGLQLRLATQLTAAEVYRRSLFEDVVVYNLFYPAGKTEPGERERITQILSDTEAPRLEIMPPKIEKQIHARVVQ